MSEVYSAEPTTALTTLPQVAIADDLPCNLPDDVYYRSRLFSSQSGINPLINAAQPVIALFNRIANSVNAPVLSDLIKNLHHELHAFETRARAYEYSAEASLIGRYLLTVTLYHKVLQTSWGANDKRAQTTLTQLIPSQNRNEQNVLSLIHKLSDDESAAAHIDLLELAYCCLSLGFPGTDRSAVDLQHYSQELQRLYDVIRKQRPNFSKSLHLSPADLATQEFAKKPIAMKWVISLAAVILLSLYTGFNYMLNQTAKPLNHQAAALEKLLAKAQPV